jgi:hypothetical protein
MLTKIKNPFTRSEVKKEFVMVNCTHCASYYQIKAKDIRVTNYCRECK